MRFTKLVKRVCILFLFAVTPALAQHKTALTWIPVTGASGYNVYMSNGSCTGTFNKITPTPVTLAAFTDTGQIDGEVRCYRITSTSLAGTVVSESIPSGTFLATTPTLTAGAIVIPPPTGLAAGIQ